MDETRTWQEHRGSLVDTGGDYRVIDCSVCGFKHIIPIPSTKDLEQIYRETYYEKEKPLYLARHREDLPWWNLVYSERYETFERLLPAHRKRILDVGCGPGFFLLHGRDRGWHVRGVEPSRRAASHARDLGLEVVESFLTETTASELGTYDVVHMHNVLEHLPDPAGMLQIAHRLLSSGGVLCVVVPNDYNPIQEALRKVCGFHPWWVVPPHHVNYFNFDSLLRLLVRSGFDPLEVEATFPIDLFLLMGDDYVGNDALGRQCHAKRKRLELTLEEAGLSRCKRQIYQDLAKQGIGREIVAYSRRKE